MTGNARPRSDTVPAAYRDLPDRAVQLLDSASDGLSDDALAVELFGAATGSRWAMLLPSILGGDPRIAYQDGRWRLAESAPLSSNTLHDPAATPSLPDISTTELGSRVVTIVLATSGADPRRHRIVHLAAVRYEGSVLTGRIDAPIRPEEPLPAVSRPAAPMRGDPAEATALADLIPGLQLLTDGQPAYVYGARRAEAFINEALQRAGLPPLSIRLVEADDLLRASLPAGRKPGLVAAARELGVPYARPGVPLSDAETLARTLDLLRERRQASPTRAHLSGVSVHQPARQSRQPLPFTAAWLEQVPDGPGVYLFQDGRGRTLYVGKARSLRRRLGDYVRQQPGANRQLEAMAVRTERVRTIGAPSDLEATLLEARLIRAQQPEFNVARTARPPLTVIRAGLDDRSPRLRLVSEVMDDGARYFGPFETVRAARQALDIARAVYPDAVARRRGDVTAQRTAVLQACQLLAGLRAPAIELLRSGMSEAAARGDQAEIDRMRATLRVVQSLDVRPSLLVGLPGGTLLLVSEQVIDGLTRTHLLQDGVRLVSVSWDIDWLPSGADKLRQLADAMLAAAEAPPDEELDGMGYDVDVSAQPEPTDPDEPALVMRWLVQAWDRVEVARVPPADD